MEILKIQRVLSYETDEMQPMTFIDTYANLPAKTHRSKEAGIGQIDVRKRQDALEVVIAGKAPFGVKISRPCSGPITVELTERERIVFSLAKK